MWTVFASLSFVILLIDGHPYVCEESYEPEDYAGHPHVPSDCLTTTPSACQRSWKTGIPEGSATSKPLIYASFLYCHESYSSCGHVPVDPETGIVLSTRGVTIGAGVDLGRTTKNMPLFRALPASLVAKLEPYIGLKQSSAACAVIERPFKLFAREALTLTNIMTGYAVEKVERDYNLERHPDALPFISLPRGIRTAIVSVWFQFGHPSSYPTFWRFVLENKWDEAANALRNFYKNPSAQRVEDLRRRNDEADIIEASLVRCTRSIDAVVLLDESGSVSEQNFKESLEFIKNLTAAIPDEKLGDRDGTRLGLSTFSNLYTAHFYLSTYSSQSQYLAAVDSVHQGGGTTSLGYALLRVADQFSEVRGLRKEERGIPRVLIVLTDGKSNDPVGTPAKHLRAMNIVIYAIGVGQFDRIQLEHVASSPSHAYTMNTFVELETFIGTLTATACNQPQPLTLKKRIAMTSEKEKYQYFLYKARTNSLLRIKVRDIVGETWVYVSRGNPHPHKYDNDFGFMRAAQKNKVIVIAVGRSASTAKRSVHEEELKPVYVSVLASTREASFAIEGSPCSPSNCTEGTNELFAPSGTGSKKNCRLFASLVIPLLVFFFAFG